MTTAVRVELSRFLTRRAVVWLILVAALLTAGLAWKTTWDSRPFTPEEIATAEAARDTQASRAAVRAEVEECLAEPEVYLGDHATEQDCRDTLVGAVADFLPRRPLDLGGTVTGNGLGLAVLLSGMMVIAGALFAGLDWRSGSIITQVLFQPRRSRLWGAKAVAVALAAAVVTALLLAGFWSVLLAVSADRGIGVDPTTRADIVLQGVRTAVLAGAGAAGGFALAMLVRSAATALALIVAATVGGEVLTTVLPSLPFDGLARWSLLNNVFGWLAPHLEYYDPATACLGLTDCGPTSLSHTAAGLYLGVLLLVTLVVSAAVFRRRDL